MDELDVPDDEAIGVDDLGVTDVVLICSDDMTLFLRSDCREYDELEFHHDTRYLRQD